MREGVPQLGDSEQPGVYDAARGKERDGALNTVTPQATSTTPRRGSGLFAFVLGLAWAGLLSACGPPLPSVSDHLSGLERAYSFLDEGEIERADRLLDDCWILDPFPEEVCLDGLPTWTEDPLEERYWRFVFYALRPTRHLLYAWRETGNGVYLDKLRAILGSLVLTPASSSPFQRSDSGLRVIDLASRGPSPV